MVVAAALAASLGSALRNAPPQPSAAAALPDIAFAGSATWGSERRQGTLCAVGALVALLVILVSGHHTLGGGGAACPASNHSAAVTWLTFKNATTSLKFTNFSITATAKIFYQLNYTNAFGKAQTEIKFAFEEPGVPDPEAIGDLLYDVGFYA